MTFVKPTYGQYLNYKFRETIPTWENARFWAQVRFRDPMDVHEYQEYLDQDGFLVDEVNQVRSLNTSGHYIKEWIKYFLRLFTYSYVNYVEDEYDYHIQSDYYDHYDHYEYYYQERYL